MDADGNRIAAIVPIAVYEKLLDAYEDQADLAAIREYEAEKAAVNLDAIPLADYLAERHTGCSMRSMMRREPSLSSLLATGGMSIAED